MNKDELKTKLEQAGVYAEAYSLDGGLPNERYVLSQEASGRWDVYYSERRQQDRASFVRLGVRRLPVFLRPCSQRPNFETEMNSLLKLNSETATSGMAGATL